MAATRSTCSPRGRADAARLTGGASRCTPACIAAIHMEARRKTMVSGPSARGGRPSAPSVVGAFRVLSVMMGEIMYGLYGSVLFRTSPILARADWDLLIFGEVQPGEIDEKVLLFLFSQKKN